MAKLQLFIDLIDDMRKDGASTFKTMAAQRILRKLLESIEREK